MTDTPKWELNEVKTSIGRAFRIGHGEMLTSGPGACIIYDDYGHGSNERSQRAALIVTAVNAHDDLVKALEHMIADCEAYHVSCTCGPKITEHEHNNMAFARSALAKAKGEKT